MDEAIKLLDTRIEETLRLFEQKYLESKIAIDNKGREAIKQGDKEKIEIKDSSQRIINFKMTTDERIKLLNAKVTKVLNLVKQKDIESKMAKDERGREVSKKEKEITEIRQKYERTINEMSKEIENINEKANKEINQTNKILQETIKHYEKKDEEIRQVSPRIAVASKRIEQKDLEKKLAIDKNNTKVNEIGNKDVIWIGRRVYTEKDIIKENFNLNEQLFVREVKIKTENNELVKKSILESANQIEFESNFMCFFEHKSKKMVVIDLITGSCIKTNMNIAEKITSNTGFCHLPNESWFYYSSSTNEGSWYIIDIVNKIGAEQKAYIHKTNIGSCCYANNSVYSFGGYINGEISSKAERFCLLSSEWQDIHQLPSACSNISTVHVNDMIIISALQFENIIEYNTTSNTYKQYFNASYSNQHSILTKGLNGIFLFKGGSLWDLTDYNQNKLEKIILNTGVPNYRLISGPIRNRGKIFFILENKQIWRFELESKEIDLIKFINLY